jgi:two-component system chemotaxis sensor kinase CheA
MDNKNDAFLKKLQATFRIEAQEHLKTISQGLIDLEQGGGGKEKERETLETVFREAHSLKGAARAINRGDIESLCQAVESLFSALKRNEVETSPALFDLLNESGKRLEALISTSEGAKRGDEGSGRVPEMVQLIERAAKGESLVSANGTPEASAKQIGPGALDSSKKIPPQPPPVSDEGGIPDTVRISTAKLVKILLGAEELISAKLFAGQRVEELKSIGSELQVWNRERARHPVGHPPVSGKAEAPFDRDRERIRVLGGKIQNLIAFSENEERLLGTVVDNLLDDMKKTLMLPFSSLLDLFPKMVRDISRDQGKEVHLTVKGGTIEADRRILEEIKAPLIHLIRNGIDHGIELPAIRKQKGKPERGTIALTIVLKEGNKVELLIEDDGAGIEVEKVKRSAVKQGILSEDEAGPLSEPEALALIFQSGFSTSPILTDISGRGLGLAIVKEKVEKLGGTADVTTSPDKGSAFRLRLPLTLATFRGVLIGAGGERFVLPSHHIERVVRITREEIRTVENRETIAYNGRPLALIPLNDLLEMPKKEKDGPGEPILAVIAGSGERRSAFTVDAIYNEQEVLVKNLGKQLSRVRNISGATVLGDGKVAPILNVPDLLKSAQKTGKLSVAPPVTGEGSTLPDRTILTADDSITSRTLLKNILESAGYRVIAAVDGMEALTFLKTESVDLVVSDVEMPRMNGFELTSRIREDKKLADLPVVLVTALDSRTDRERGIEAGANAYIVKSTFDQSNLLEVIGRLL